MSFLICATIARASWLEGRWVCREASGKLRTGRVVPVDELEIVEAQLLSVTHGGEASMGSNGCAGRTGLRGRSTTV
eukprot:921699-Rhodomonas_salina.1